jgi:hypothetical protein
VEVGAPIKIEIQNSPEPCLFSVLQPDATKQTLRAMTEADRQWRTPPGQTVAESNGKLGMLLLHTRR